MSSKAASTTSRYGKEIKKFFKWCNSVNIEAVPPFSSALLLAYLSKVLKDSQSYSSLVLSYSALKWLHSLLPDNGVNPLDSSACHQLLESAKRSKNPIKKKKPLTADMLKEIIDKHGHPLANLKDLRIASICALGFAGFLRYDELSQMLISHLEFLPNHLRILIPKAKNDIYREGNYVYINKLDNAYCPVTLLSRYIEKANLKLGSNDTLFRQVRFLKKTNSYKLCGKGLSYTRCLELFKACLKDLGYDEKLYGLHSLRSGGATSAVKNNPNLSDRVLKLHGRWKSDTAKDMYVLEDVEKRLSLTKNLGLIE